jgi:hypothetical protein
LKRAKFERLVKELERWGIINEKDEKLYLTNFFREILIKNFNERPQSKIKDNVSESIILSVLDIAQPLTKTRLCDYCCVIKGMMGAQIDN